MMTLHGRIFSEGEQYVSHCHELNISTAGSTVQEAMERTFEMIEFYLQAAEKKGLLAEVLQHVSPGAEVDKAAGLRFHTHFTIEGEVAIR